MRPQSPRNAALIAARAGGSPLFFPRIVRRIDVGDGPRSDAVNLPDGLLARPHEVASPRWHDRDAAGSQRAGLGPVEHVSHPHVQRAGYDRDVLDPWMPMGRDLVVRG